MWKNYKKFEYTTHVCKNKIETSQKEKYEKLTCLVKKKTEKNL